ncbi:MAG: hypothetical protein U1A78_00645 [Polyangia bacterium]
MMNNRILPSLRRLLLGQEDLLPSAELEASGLFDRAWYLEVNPDVAQAGLDPLQHYLRAGRFEGRGPNPYFDGGAYLALYPDVAANGMDPLVHYVRYGAVEGREPFPGFGSESYVKQHPDALGPGMSPLLHYIQSERRAGRTRPARDIERIQSERFPALRPLHLTAQRGEEARITLVTDGREPGLLLGQPSLALVLASRLAAQRGARLRIVTRHAPIDARRFQTLCAACGSAWPSDVEQVHADVAADTSLGLLRDELFLTTDSATTWSVKQSLAEQRIVYLVSEDERQRYPAGDERALCDETLRSPHVRFVLTSRRLLAHFAKEGFANIRERGVCLEPAFPPSQYHAEAQSGGRKGFLFYARPDEPAALYYRGLSVLKQAILRGALDPYEWEICLVGKGVTVPPALPLQTQPTIVNDPAWPEYVALLRRMRAGLVLRDAPELGRAALELAACGAHVVTNRPAAPDDRDATAEAEDTTGAGLVCRDLDVMSLVDGVAEAVRRARGGPEAASERTGLVRDWDAALAPVLRHLLAE